MQMVSGHTQVIDSALVKANASIDCLELKVLASNSESHLRAVRHISNRDKAAPLRPAKKNKAPKSQQTLSAGKQEL